MKLDSAEALSAIRLAGKAENFPDLYPGLIDKNSNATNMRREARQNLPSPFRRKIARAGRVKVKPQDVGTKLYRL